MLEEMQELAIQIFKNLGYEEIEKTNLNFFENGIQTDILEKQMEKINKYEYNNQKHKFRNETIKQAIENLLINKTYFTNEAIYDLLTIGTSYEETMEDDSKKAYDIKYIDFENINNNVFNIARDYTFVNKKSEILKFDIVVFINGIPIAIIDIKNQYLESGIEQTIKIQEKFPEFFKFIQVIMVFNKEQAKYATSTSKKEQFTIWKEQKESLIEEILKPVSTKRKINNQDKIITSIFFKERLLDLIKNYILYNEGEKTIARSQQYFTVNAILKRTNEVDKKGKRKGGIIYHATGAGKTITMVYTIKQLLEKQSYKDIKILIITDRKEKETQIEQIFNKIGIKVENATTGLNLIELIENKNIRLINTVINKFETAIKYNMQVESRNVFILIDEASRTQNGVLSKNMQLIFKNATYLFFTSVPLQNTKKFGELITPIYNPSQLIKDNLTVPLIYEKKAIYEPTEETKQNIWIIREYEKRIHEIAIDINKHYKKYLQNTGFNAILACDTISQAIKYYQELEKIGELKIGIIVDKLERKQYEENSEIGNFCFKLLKEYKNEKIYEETIKTKFIKGEIDIIIVVNKLLTSLTATKATALYIDKKLTGTTLIQAIGRINRSHKGKDFGYIIDYRDIQEELEKYSKLGFEYVFYTINMQIEKMENSYKKLKEILKNKQEMEEIEILLEDNNIRVQFYREFNIFASLLGNILPNNEACSKLENIEKYKKDLLFYQTIRKNIQMRYAQDIDNKEYEPKLQKTLDTYLNTKATLRMKEYCDITKREEFEKEYKIMKTKRAKADLIKSKLVRIMQEENKIYYDKFLEKIENITIKFKKGKITDTQYLEEMQKIKESFFTGSIKKIEGTNIQDEETKAIFIAIYNRINLKKASINEIEKLAINIRNGIQVKIKKDWQQNKQIQNSIRQIIDEQLYYYTQKEQIEISFEKLDEIIEIILNIAMLHSKI